MKAKSLVVLISCMIMSALVVPAAYAARLQTAAVDGDGLMAVLPTSVTYGSSTTLTFTFTANADFASGMWLTTGRIIYFTCWNCLPTEQNRSFISGRFLMTLRKPLCRREPPG